MNLKSNGLCLFIGCCIGTFLGYKLSNKVLPPLKPLVAIEEEVTKTYDPLSGKLIGEVITKKQTPIPQPKPRYKITLIPAYNFLDQKFEFMGLYEKRYLLPIIGEVYLGMFVSSKLTLGVSISKEFY